MLSDSDGEALLNMITTLARRIQMLEQKLAKLDRPSAPWARHVITRHADWVGPSRSLDGKLRFSQPIETNRNPAVQ